MKNLFVGKTTLETILFIVLAVAGALAPGLGWITVDHVTLAFLNIGAFIVLTMGLTSVAKQWVGYDGEDPGRKKWIPKAIAFGWSGILSSVSYFASFGIFAVFNAYYEVLISAILLAGVTRDMYSLDIATQIIKMITGKDLNEVEK